MEEKKIFKQLFGNENDQDSITICRTFSEKISISILEKFKLAESDIYVFSISLFHYFLSMDDEITIDQCFNAAFTCNFYLGKLYDNFEST